MALRVGVTGHRAARLAPDQRARIAQQIEAVLEATSKGIHHAHSQYTEDYAPAAPIPYFVSALADGADTLAAQTAR